MNMMKKNGGFTLVELIVVIAILAILAGVAVPAYTGYIKKAEQAKDVQVLSTINTAAQGLAVAENLSITKIQVAAASADAAITVTTSDNKTDSITEAEVEALTGETKGMFNSEFKGANWADGKWTLN